jgi:glyceraldehyde-3-phosphate dehydrogenase/erythrose-4-phosphate dehydrogenase
MVNAVVINRHNGNLAKIPAWYDNETGFSHRRLDLAVAIGSR